MNAPTALYAYRHHNTYFVYPCYYEGYPSGLGTTLVQNIPSEPQEFDDWLRESREHYDHVLENLSDSSPADDLGYYRRPSSELPSNDMNVIWVYTIDLDRKVFSIDNGAHFKLDNIPRGDDGEEWIKYLGQDGLSRRCLKLFTPRSIVAELHPEIDDAAITDTTTRYHSLDATVIAVADWTKNCRTPELPSQAITETVLRALIGQFYGTLCDACQYIPIDPRFQRPAECLLRAAAPDFLQLHLDIENIPGPGLSPSKKVDEDDHSSRGLFYWFRGCLILLSTHLDSEMHLQANIVRIVAHIREKGIESCNALVWSIRHVVVIRVSHGRIEHSIALPVLAAFGIDDVAFSASIRVLAHCLRPAYALNENDESETMPVRTRTSTGNKDNVRKSAIHEEEPPGVDDTRISLPPDVVLEIMKFVDAETYCNSFGILSKATRIVCFKRPRIGSYTICGIIPSSLDEEESSRELCEAGIVEERLIDGCTLLAHTENECPVRLRLQYEGHPFLGNCPLTALYQCTEIGKSARVCARWPLGLGEESEGADRKTGPWRDARQFGLSLRVLT